MNEKEKNNFGLQNKKNFLEQLIQKEVRINVYGVTHIGVLKEIDAENIYLSPHLVVEALPNEYDGKITYRIETDYPLPIPKIAICAPEKLSTGYMKKLALLGNKRENNLEKNYPQKKKLKLYTKNYKKQKQM